MVIDTHGFVLGWTSLALINAAIANAARRAPLAYFLCSLLVGPLATIVLATTYEDEAGHLRGVPAWGRTPSSAVSSRWLVPLVITIVVVLAVAVAFAAAIH